MMVFSEVYTKLARFLLHVKCNQNKLVSVFYMSDGNYLLLFLKADTLIDESMV